jgi:hypothetical protein
VARGRRIPPLSRRLATRLPKKRFILYCEGKNTEPGYFRALSQRFRDALITIEAIGDVGDPSRIAERAITRATQLGLVGNKRRPANSFEAADEVWAMFDRDEHEHFAGACARCTQKGIRIAISNPCFEVWLILHFSDFDRPEHRREVQRVLRRFCPEYDPNRRKELNFQDALDNLSQAEERAELLVRRREAQGDPLGSPCTTVHELTRRIQAARTTARR